jgi:4-hydroxy-tetrahydrodipicolinate synthase
MHSTLPNGSWPVIFTPFTESNEVDYRALDAAFDFYLGTRQAGLFANALSGEVFDLTLDECVQIAARLVNRSAGRLPILSGAASGNTLEEQAEALKALQGTGVDATVILLSALPKPDSLVEQVLELAEKVEGPLGLYECPLPEHRLLDAEQVRTLASTGRFVFLKETSRQTEIFLEKLAAAEGTPLRVFQANLRCAPESLRDGAPGVCGIFCNFCPEWSATLCDRKAPKADRETAFRALVAFHDAILSHGYPASGKYLLQKRGVAMTLATRKFHNRRFDDSDRAFLDSFFAEFGLADGAPSVTQERLEKLLTELGAIKLVD